MKKAFAALAGIFGIAAVILYFSSVKDTGGLKIANIQETVFCAACAVICAVNAAAAAILHWMEQNAFNELPSGGMASVHNSWVCPNCGNRNAMSRPNCGVCGTEYGKSPESMQRAFASSGRMGRMNRTDEDDGLDLPPAGYSPERAFIDALKTEQSMRGIAVAWESSGLQADCPEADRIISQSLESDTARHLTPGELNTVRSMIRKAIYDEERRKAKPE